MLTDVILVIAVWGLIIGACIGIMKLDEKGNGDK